MAEGGGDISVVMPARNAAATIRAALLSVLDQARLGQVIVVDDGSQDGTGDLARGLGDPRVEVIAGPGTGIAAALNAGIAQARGAYVARCDSDDLFTPGRLAEQAAFLDAHPEFVATGGGYVSIDAGGRELAFLACEGADREVSDLLRAGKVQTHLCTWLIRAPVLRRSGGARPWFETAEDVDLQFRLACEGRVWHMARPMYRYRLHGGSITHGRRLARLAFFDRMAVEFLAERRRSGRDALDLGQPPDIPDFDTIAAEHAPEDKLAGQVLGHLTSQAWRDHAAGRHGAALGRMVRVVVRAPLRLASWRGLAVMAVKSLRAVLVTGRGRGQGRG